MWTTRGEEQVGSNEECEVEGVGVAGCWRGNEKGREEEDVEGWKQRWNTGQVGFHLDEVHPLLLKHLTLLLPLEPTLPLQKSVLVPLCGKTLDLTYLAVSGHRVFGIEVSPLAGEQYFSESRLPRTSTSSSSSGPRWRVHSSGNIVFLQGDLFSLSQRLLPQTVHTHSIPPSSSSFTSSSTSSSTSSTSSSSLSTLSSSPHSSAPTPSLHLPSPPSVQEEALALIRGDPFQVDGIWDRGSMVAIPPGRRAEYASLLAALLRPGGRLLLLGLHYNETQAQGPPHSLRYHDVQRLYEPLGFSVDVVASREVIDSASPRMRAQGLTSITEALYLLKKE